MVCRSDLPRLHDVVVRYGYKYNRAGFMRCPFHDEKTASLKIYTEGRGFYCFGCRVGGSVIDFVMRLFNIDYRTAMDKLTTDFSIQSWKVKPTKYQVQKLKVYVNTEKIKHDEAEQKYWKAFDEFARLDRNKVRYKPENTNEPLHELFVEALQKLCKQEYILTMAEMRLKKYENSY